MKAMKRDLQAMVKQLKALTAKAEKLAGVIDKKAAPAPASKPAAKRGRPVKAASKTAAPKREATAMDTVFGVVAKSKKGVDTATIKEKTGFNDKKIWNAINRLKTQGKIKSARKGMYVKI